MAQSRREGMENEVVELLKKYKLTITTAESCTGGLIAAALVNVAGASDVLNEGYITYSDGAKERLLHVKPETLEKHGAVSEQTAIEMAKGAALAAHADVALSATGIAGPDGGTQEKPVGLVYIGCYVEGHISVLECEFHGTRMENRLNTVESALTLARDELLTYEEKSEK